MTADGANHTILVVEDEHLVRRLLGRVLAQPGTEVLMAADGAEALEIYQLRESEISVVLLDLGLPKISGWDVFNTMKQKNPAVRVVVSSGYVEPELKNRFQGAGVTSFIDKPYVLGHLAKVVEKEIEAGESIRAILAAE